MGTVLSHVGFLLGLGSIRSPPFGDISSAVAKESANAELVGGDLMGIHASFTTPEPGRA